MEEYTVTLTDLKKRVDILIKRKDEYLKGAISRVLSANEVEDHFKMLPAYNAIIDKNGEALDLLRDLKDEESYVRSVRDYIDASTQLGSLRLKQIDILLRILGDQQKVMYIEKEKLDRMIRYYERASNNYNY